MYIKCGNTEKFRNHDYLEISLLLLKIINMMLVIDV